VSIAELNLVSPTTVGSIITISARITFTSSRSLEVQVLGRTTDATGERIVASGLFNFVSLDKTGRPCEIPPISPDTPARVARAAAGAQRYAAAKEARRAAAVAKAKPVTE
jgi:acyl-coenzyme A thioesterase 7